MQPTCVILYCYQITWKYFQRLTWKETESLAAKATISAQETTPGQVFSRLVLTSSITSNPARDWFGIASFSALLFAVESSSIEPSQPCRSTYIYIYKIHGNACMCFMVWETRTRTKQSWKCILRNLAGRVELQATCFQMMSLTMFSARGQLSW